MTASEDISLLSELVILDYFLHQNIKLRLDNFHETNFEHLRKAKDYAICIQTLLSGLKRIFSTIDEVPFDEMLKKRLIFAKFIGLTFFTKHGSCKNSTDLPLSPLLLNESICCLEHCYLARKEAFLILPKLFEDSKIERKGEKILNFICDFITIWAIESSFSNQAMNKKGNSNKINHLAGNGNIRKGIFNRFQEILNTVSLNHLQKIDLNYLARLESMQSNFKKFLNSFDDIVQLQENVSILQGKLVETLKNIYQEMELPLSINYANSLLNRGNGEEGEGKKEKKENDKNHSNNQNKTHKNRNEKMMEKDSKENFPIPIPIPSSSTFHSDNLINDHDSRSPIKNQNSQIPLPYSDDVSFTLHEGETFLKEPISEVIQCIPDKKDSIENLSKHSLNDQSLNFKAIEEFQKDKDESKGENEDKDKDNSKDSTIDSSIKEENENIEKKEENQESGESSKSASFVELTLELSPIIAPLSILNSSFPKSIPELSLSSSHSPLSIPVPPPSNIDIPKRGPMNLSIAKKVLAEKGIDLFNLIKDSFVAPFSSKLSSVAASESVIVEGNQKETLELKNENEKENIKDKESLKTLNENILKKSIMNRNDSAEKVPWINSNSAFSLLSKNKNHPSNDNFSEFSSSDSESKKVKIEKEKREINSIDATMGDKKRFRFSKEEIDNLKHGYKKYGRQWTLILNSFKFNKGRTSVNLKDKARDLDRKGILMN